MVSGEGAEAGWRDEHAICDSLEYDTLASAYSRTFVLFVNIVLGGGIACVR